MMSPEEFMRGEGASNSPLRRPPPDYFPPGSGRWFEIPSGKDAGKKLFYYDYIIGEGEPQATVFFVHGNPECSYTYRHIRDALIQSQAPIRLIAVDHIGYGLSDRADFEMVEIHHAENLRQLVTHLDLNDLTLVIHDWGGPIGVQSFTPEPQRVKNLLLMNTTIFPMPPDGFTYLNYPVSWLPWSVAPKLIPNGLWGGVAAYVVPHAKPQTTFKFLGNTLLYALRHGLKLFKLGTPEYVFSQMLRSRANVKSSKRLVLQTPVWGTGWEYHDPRYGPQDNRPAYKTMQEMVRRNWGRGGQNIKATACFGRWDACGKPSVEQQWRDTLPQLEGHVHSFDDIGHFIEEYKGPEMARSILAMNDLT